MKKKLPLIALMFLAMSIYAQDIHFTIANTKNTTDGTDDFYEADIFIESTEDFKLGSGQIYFNYNTAAFGEFVKSNDNFEYLQPTGSILAATNSLPIYSGFTDNDNTASRVSTAFSQGLSGGSITENNVTSTPAHLFSIKIKYTDVSQSPDITFETGNVFLDQFFTACGPTAGFGFPDCTNEPGIQLFNDTFDSGGATLTISDFDIASAIKVYPNPAENVLNINTNDLSVETLKIFNVNGLLIKNIAPNTIGDSIDINDLKTGIYFLQVTSENRKHTIKLLKI